MRLKTIRLWKRLFTIFGKSCVIGFEIFYRDVRFCHSIEKRSIRAFILLLWPASDYIRLFAGNDAESQKGVLGPWYSFCNQRTITLGYLLEMTPSPKSSIRGWYYICEIQISLKLIKHKITNITMLSNALLQMRHCAKKRDFNLKFLTFSWVQCCKDWLNGHCL